jgi:hypothetical protein
MTDEDDLLEVFIRQDVNEVLDVCLEPDPSMREMGALAEPSQRRGIHIVPGTTEQGGELFPTPAAMPGAVD